MVDSTTPWTPPASDTASQAPATPTWTPPAADQAAGGAPVWKPPATDVSSNSAPVTEPTAPQTGGNAGPQVRGRFGMENLQPQPTSLHDVAGVGASALDGATFGADRLIPGSVGTSINKARTDLVASDPSAASAASGLGGIVSPVTKLAGPVSKLVEAADPVMAAGRRLASSTALGGLNGYGTSNNTGAARVEDGLHGAEAGLALGAVGEGAGAAINKLSAAPKPNPLAAVDPTILQSRQRVADLVRAQQASTGTGETASATQAVKNAISTQNGHVASYARNLMADPSLTAGQKDGLTSLIPALKSQALGAHNMLGVDASGNPDGSAANALTQLHGLGIDPAKLAPLTEGLRDLDTMSQNKFVNQTSGPAAKIGAKIAQGAPAVIGGLVGLEHGTPEMGGLVGGAISAGAHRVLGDTGSAIGGIIDRARGTNVPPILKQGDAAGAYLDSIGVPRAPSTLQAINQARWGSPDAPKAPDEPLIGGFTQAQIDAMRLKQAAQGNAQAVKDQARAAKAQTSQRGADVSAAFSLTPAEKMKAGITNRANATMATEGLPVSGDSIPIVNHVESTLQKARDKIDPPIEEAPGVPTVLPVSPGPSVPPPPGQAPVTLSAAPAAPQEPTAPKSDFLGLADHLSQESLWGPVGVKLSPEELHAGLQSALSSGKLSPEQGEQLAAHLTSNTPMRNDGGRATPAFNTVLQHAQALKGGIPVPDVNPVAPRSYGSAVPNGGERPVDNAYQFQSAAASYQAHGKTLVDLAMAAKDPNLALTVAKIVNTPEVALKQAMKEEFIKTLTDPQAIARANSFLSGRIMTQGKK